MTPLNHQFHAALVTGAVPVQAATFQTAAVTHVSVVPLHHKPVAGSWTETSTPARAALSVAPPDSLTAPGLSPALLVGVTIVTAGAGQSNTLTAAGSKIWMRSLPASATYRRPWASWAIPVGFLNW